MIRVLTALPLFALYTLVVPHSNAACEVIFSKINLTKVKLRNRLAVNAVEVCVSASQHVNGAGGCVNFTPMESMVSQMTSVNLHEKENEDDIGISEED